MQYPKGQELEILKIAEKEKKNPEIKQKLLIQAQHTGQTHA